MFRFLLYLFVNGAKFVEHFMPVSKLCIVYVPKLQIQMTLNFLAVMYLKNKTKQKHFFFKSKQIIIFISVFETFGGFSM